MEAYHKDGTLARSAAVRKNEPYVLVVEDILTRGESESTCLTNTSGRALAPPAEPLSSLPSAICALALRGLNFLPRTSGGFDGEQANTCEVMCVFKAMSRSFLFPETASAAGQQVRHARLP